MLKIRYQVKFKKDYKRAIKRGYNKKLFKEVLFYLVNEKPLPEKYRDHYLTGDYKGFRNVIFNLIL